MFSHSAPVPGYLVSLKNAGRKRRPCITCGHPEVARINFAIASGGTVSAVARKFGVPLSSLNRHAENHISPEYRAVVQSSPLESEEQLRKLAAESGSSVIENLSVIYGALANRWLRAFEIADDFYRARTAAPRAIEHVGTD